MAGIGFGLPKGLLNNSTQLPAQSAPVLPIPPAPSFGDLKFQLIGKQPRLLERFSESIVAQGSEHSENMSATSDNEQQYRNLEPNVIPRNRPSLSQALSEPNPAYPASPTISDNVTSQAPAKTSHFPLVNPNSTVSAMRVSNHPFNVSKISSTQEGSSSSLNSLPNSLAMDGNTEHQTSSGFAAPMQLSYPSTSPGPGALTDHAMEGVQATRAPDRPSLPPTARKYEGLRQIQARLQSSILNVSSPNLASVVLLTESAHQKATALQADARRLHNSSQETLIAAQKSAAAAQALLKVADEVRGLAEGAKAELDRLSSNQQRSMSSEIRELFQTMDNWISNQEADEAALRARRIEQLKLRKQKAELARASAQHSTTSPSNASTTTSSAVTVQVQTPTLPAPPPARQPLFFSPTPEVDVKVDPRTWAQPASQNISAPSPAPAMADLARRQEDLRKKLKEKLSVEAESRPASPSDVNRLEQQRLEEEQRWGEQGQKEVLVRKLAEKKAHEEEERKVGEKAPKEKEEIERKPREQAEAEREAHEAAATEAKKTRSAAEAQKTRDAMEAQRKAKEAAEEAKRKAQEEEQEIKRRQAEVEAEAEKQRMAAFLIRQKQEQERQAKLAEEAKQRALREEKEREQRLLEEQARMKAEREKEEKLRQEQELRRQQVQEERSKILADRAQQIRAQRESRLRSLDATSEMSMSLDSSPVTSTLVLNPRDPASEPPASSIPSADEPLPSPLEPQLRSVPNQTSVSQLFSSRVQDTLNTVSPTNVSTSHHTAHHNMQRSPKVPLQPATPTRNPSLPPVAHFSPADPPPPLPQPRPLAQSTWSIHRLSGDGGNLPYRENPNLSPQAQAANLRHVVNALHLPPLDLSQPVTPDQSRIKLETAYVKMEPVQDDSLLLQVPTQHSTNETIPIRPRSSQSQAHIRVESESRAPHRALPPGPAGQSLPVRPLHGSRTNMVLDQPLPSSSPSVTDVSVNVHDYQQQQQEVLQGPNQTQLSSQLPSSLNSQTHLSSYAGSQGQPPQLILPPTDQRSRSRSPFRMGPDEYNLQSVVRTPSDTNSDNHPPPLVYRGRPEPQNSAPAHWDHYSPAPRSPPRGSNTYRPNYAIRARSPVAGRKRSRDYSPPPHTPIIRDYREYDDRRPSRRYSRSPPPRRSRPMSRSPSPPYPDRPPLASRLTQGTGGGDSYRPPSPHEPKSSRPELLDRFTDAQPPFDASTRPGRGRGRRGRGGPPVSGHGHTSLEQRISGATLMNRLEDPPRRP